MKKHFFYSLFILALAISWQAPFIKAQSGGAFDIRQSVIANGGGQMTGSAFSVESIIGQALAGGQMFGGSFAISNGFSQISSSGCSYQFDRTNINASAGSGVSASIQISTIGGCGWTAVNHTPWISISNGATGVGNGSVTLGIADNINGAARTGTVYIANQAVTVNQAADSNYSISGTFRYGTTPLNQPAKFVPDVNLITNGAYNVSSITDPAGLYSLAGLGAGAYTITASKTAQATNTGISLQDASEVAKYVFNQVTPTANQRLAGDATNNGSLSLQDASEIAKRAFNIQSSNAVGSWKFSPAQRSYASRTAGLTNENFDAVLVGDVTGNWTAPLNSIQNEPVELSEQTAVNQESTIFQKLADSQTPQPQGNLRSDNSAVAVPVSLPNTSGTPNATVVIPVMVGDLTSRGITAYDFTVSFNTSVLEPASPAFDTTGTMTAAAGGYTVVVDPTQPSGRLRIGAFGTTPLTGAGTVINLRFNVVNGAGGAVSPLNFVEFIFGEGTPEATMTNGSFTRTGGVPTAATVTVAGKVLGSAGKGLRGARVSITDQNGETRTVLSGTFGNYRIENVRAGETYTISVLSKKYVFLPQIVNVREEISELNFAPEP
ncbi:MAG TPA: carboxypeptidase regulatory-like domain-containing protein [Pyrinomonadaceae bacterium]|nr:carboxypeptidase regulatory-like domain-containing protein [Pyrinomonadaceae bacterium]